MEDDDLRRLLTAGRHDQAIELLHRRHAVEVARYVRSRQRRRPEASTEDVCQEVWISARRAIATYDFTCTPRTWLFGIAKRRVIDHWRGRRDEEEPAGPALDDLVAAATGDRGPSTPHSRAVRKERGAALERVLAAFEPSERELLELRLVHELTPSEIVEICGLELKPNTLIKRLERLLPRLVKSLVKEEAFASRRAPKDRGAR